jgi:hypothetical protein
LGDGTGKSAKWQPRHRQATRAARMIHGLGADRWTRLRRVSVTTHPSSVLPDRHPRSPRPTPSSIRLASSPRAPSIANDRRMKRTLTNGPHRLPSAPLYRRVPERYLSQASPPTVHTRGSAPSIPIPRIGLIRVGFGVHMKHLGLPETLQQPSLAISALPRQARQTVPLSVEMKYCGGSDSMEAVFLESWRRA